MSKKNQKVNTEEVLMDLAKGVAGAYAANMITTEYEAKLIKDQKPTQNAPMLAAAGGILLGMYGPKEYRPLAIGMVAMSGNEIIPNIMNKDKAAAAPTTTTTTTAPTATTTTATTANAATTRINAATQRINMAYTPGAY